MEEKARQEIRTRITRIDPRRLKLLEVNARYMRHETFMRLTDNVKQDGGLTSVPFAWRIHDDETRLPLEGEYEYEVLSGNHRVMSAIAADLPEIDVMLTDDYLSPDRRKAIQISHNSLAGEDDPAILKLLYEGIADVGLKMYSGLDDKTLKLLKEVDAASLNEANLTFQTISMVFLPEELEAVNAAWELAKKSLSGIKAAWLLSFAEYDQALDAIEAASMASGVKNTATTLMLVLEVFTRHITDLAALYTDEDGEATDKHRRVPLDTVFGADGLPAPVAAALRKLVDKKRGAGEIEHAWQVLPLLLNAIEAEHGKQ